MANSGKPVPLSRQKFKCLVCQHEYRSDKLKAHYLQNVKFTSQGDPANSSDLLCSVKSVKEHTQFFRENGYSMNNVPKLSKHKRTGVPENPFEAAKPKKSRSKSRPNKVVEAPSTATSETNEPEPSTSQMNTNLNVDSSDSHIAISHDDNTDNEIGEVSISTTETDTNEQGPDTQSLMPQAQMDSNLKDCSDSYMAISHNTDETGVVSISTTESETDINEPEPGTQSHTSQSKSQMDTNLKDCSNSHIAISHDDVVEVSLLNPHTEVTDPGPGSKGNINQSLLGSESEANQAINTKIEGVKRAKQDQLYAEPSNHHNMPRPDETSSKSESHDESTSEQTQTNTQGIAKAILQEIKHEIQEENSEILEGLADKISEMVVKHIKAAQKKDKSEQNLPIGNWHKGEEYMCCIDCVKYSDSPEIPAGLKKFKRGNFGMVKLDQEQRNLKHAMDTHLQSELHTWCFNKSIQVTKQSTKQQVENEQVTEMIVRNAVFCFKNSMGAQDFIKLNDKDNLTTTIKTNATKNDSRQEFFTLRNITYEKTAERVKTLFQEVDAFSVTLDKVTVSRVSFTVILSYFFLDGSIYIVLNNLHKMQIKDYDAKGHANFVIQSLIETTGLSKDQLATKCVHFAYDGVYATKEERVSGGGSLSLVNHVAEELNLEPGDITGQWDIAHNLQLIWADSLKTNPEVQKTVKLIFDFMKDYNTGKSAQWFKEVAEELHYAVLTNKQYQETRFVRATLRGLQAGLRNLPTLYNIQGQQMQENVLAHHNLNAAKAKKKMDQINNGQTVCIAIGICQILEVYATASLDAQHNSRFPTTVLEAIDKAKDKISDYSKKWYWEKTVLKKAGIGCPDNHIHEMLTKSVYKPYVPRSITADNRWLFVDNEVDIDESPANLLNSEIPAENIGAGEICIEFDEEKKEKCEEILQNMCTDLIKNWDTRLRKTKLQKAAEVAFTGYANIDQTSDEKTKLQELISSIPGPSSDQFTAEDCIVGYLEYKQYKMSKKEFTPEQIWEAFYKKNKDNPGIQPFIRLYQNINIRSTSEAAAETVGSMMNIHKAKGRNLHPHNYSKELYIAYNLGPLHLLDKFIKEIASQRLAANTQYIRKLEGSLFSGKLKSVTSSSIANFRKKQEERSHLPPRIWRQ